MHSKFSQPVSFRSTLILSFELSAELSDWYVSLRSARGTIEKVAHLMIHYQTAVDDPEVRSTDISPVSKTVALSVMLDQQLTGNERVLYNTVLPIVGNIHTKTRK